MKQSHLVSLLLILLLLPLYNIYHIIKNMPPTGLSSVFSGSAWAVNSDGYFVSAGHMAGSSKNFRIKYNDVWYSATLVAVDTVEDIAVFKVNVYTPNFLPIQITISDGTPVKILGYPAPDTYGYDLKSSSGLLFNDFLSNDVDIMDTKVCHGNSGGPIMGMNGVVGILDGGRPVKPDDLCMTSGHGPNSEVLATFLRKNHVKYDIVNTKQAYNSIVLIVAF